MTQFNENAVGPRGATGNIPFAIGRIVANGPTGAQTVAVGAAVNF
ncbi:hypothetical protein [Bacillus thuringiensis]|nr:hypothetical protein [Bacillus thuringiensis]